MSEPKKKRAYAAQAYEFGANAAGAPGAGGVPQPPAPGYGAPQAAYPAQQTGYGAPQAGYGAPVPAYGQNVPQSPQQPLDQQFGQMNLGPGPAPAQVMPQSIQNSQNPLVGSDLMQQPLQAWELEIPPPPINLPANVSLNAPEVGRLGGDTSINILAESRLKMRKIWDFGCL